MVNSWFVEFPNLDYGSIRYRILSMRIIVLVCQVTSKSRKIIRLKNENRGIKNHTKIVQLRY